MMINKTTITQKLHLIKSLWKSHLFEKFAKLKKKLIGQHCKWTSLLLYWNKIPCFIPSEKSNAMKNSKKFCCHFTGVDFSVSSNLSLIFQTIPANNDTEHAIRRHLDRAIIARRIRIVPVSNSTRTVCMRVEVFGCPFDGLYFFRF